jgi:hypothetical protein
MKIATRSSAIVSAAIAIGVAVTGCSSHSAAAPSAHAASPTVTVTVTAGPGSGQPTAAAPTAPAVQSAATPAAAPAAPPTQAAQSQGSLTAKITIIGTTTGLVPGGAAVRFIVTATNQSTRTYSNILPLVSLSHCSCTASTLFPAGTMQERESTTNVWQTIPYDVEGFGTDYLHVSEPGGIQELPPGATATFEYRAALSPATSAQVTRGTGAFDVALIQLPSETQIGHSPAASASVDIQPGQPPA